MRPAPDLPQVHLAMGFFHYHAERNYEGALAEFAIARKGLPSDADVPRAVGAVERRQGKWEVGAIDGELSQRRRA